MSQATLIKETEPVIYRKKFKVEIDLGGGTDSEMKEFIAKLRKIGPELDFGNWLIDIADIIEGK